MPTVSGSLAASCNAALAWPGVRETITGPALFGRSLAGRGGASSSSASVNISAASFRLSATALSVMVISVGSAVCAMVRLPPSVPAVCPALALRERSAAVTAPATAPVMRQGRLTSALSSAPLSDTRSIADSAPPVPPSTKSPLPMRDNTAVSGSLGISVTVAVAVPTALW